MMTENITAMLAQAIGKTTEETAEMLEKSPKLKKLLSEMKEEDAAKLMALLSDRESVAKILATPQARTLLEALGKKGQQ